MVRFNSVGEWLSGQKQQAVNLPVRPTMVRIHLHPRYVLYRSRDLKMVGPVNLISTAILYCCDVMRLGFFEGVSLITAFAVVSFFIFDEEPLLDFSD